MTFIATIGTVSITSKVLLVHHKLEESIMTSQIFIGNQNGVVVASDTMVSWEAPHGGTKTLPESNKIYDLGIQHQVVVTDSGKASLAGLLWSSIIREWGLQLSSPLTTLREYVDSFCEWTKKGISNFGFDEIAFSQSYFCLSLQDLNNLTDGAIKNIIDSINNQLDKIDIPQIEKLFIKIFDDIDFGTKKYKDMTPAKLAEFYENSGGKEVFYKHALEDLSISWEPSKALNKCLNNIVDNIFTHFIDGYEYTSLNFIGFGSKEPFASCIDIAIRGFFNGSLRTGPQEDESESMKTRGWWTFSAQKSAMQSILEGWNPDVRAALDIVDDVLRSDFGFTDNQIEKLFKDNAMDKISRHFQERYIWPSKSLIQDLALPGLVKFADSLVHIQSLRSVLEGDEATVGGIVEVVSIDRTYGVVWHRKLTARLSESSAHILA